MRCSVSNCADEAKMAVKPLEIAIEFDTHYLVGNSLVTL